MSEKQRLSKVLAGAGIASRRACEKLITDGHITVNNEVVLIPQTPVSLKDDVILVDGEKVSQTEQKVYYIVNKPKGYICSSRRSGKRTRLVIDLFADSGKRLFTVGRLDKDTTGLILVTNDGHICNKIIHPSANLQKEYVAKTNKEITEEHLKMLTKGVFIEGTFIKPITAKKVRKGVVKVVVMEGKKHEVRLLIAAAGLEVLELKRTRLGNLRLGSLPPGGWRALDRSEVEHIFD